jgi:site-specific DNA recombinase
MSKHPLRRCAVYTRKSSEEGLEQEFNSLDAQREAGIAFVKSQSGEGWRLVETQYDDGGISGGTLERPALQRLLQDIDAGRVQVVVVYKVDRLTRSLADFAKLVEVFEKKGVSFVSVTQQFNTTTSMGRLMLNVLLSFAQFEREVTGERIRDKIAASKKKGMWMGGTPPIGYEVNGRRLEVVQDQAATVQHIFRRYTELGCITLLARDLAREGVRTRRYSSTAGRSFGGCAFSRGHVHRILTNRMYLGQIEHRGAVYPGEHAAIIDEELWEKVQTRIAANRNGHKRSKAVDPSSPLPGKVFDDAGNLMTAVRVRKGSREHRYYVSRAILDQRRDQGGSVTRVPAVLLETAVLRIVQNSASKSFISPPARLVRGDGGEGQRRTDLFSDIRRVVVSAHHLHIEMINLDAESGLDGDSTSVNGSSNPQESVLLKVPFELERRGGSARVIGPSDVTVTQGTVNAALVKVIVQGTEWARWLLTGEVASVREVARKAGVSTSYVSRLIRYAFLAPNISEAILDGKPGVSLVEFGQSGTLPLGWAEQGQLVGVSLSTASKKRAIQSARPVSRKHR